MSNLIQLPVFWSLSWMIMLPVAILLLVDWSCGQVVRALDQSLPRRVALWCHCAGVAAHELAHAATALPFGIIPSQLRIWQPSPHEGVMGDLQLRYQRSLLSFIGLPFAGIAPLALPLAWLALGCPLSDWLVSLALGGPPHPPSLAGSAGFVVGAALATPLLAYVRLSSKDLRTAWPLWALCWLAGGTILLLIPSPPASLSPALVLFNLRATVATLLLLFACACSWLFLQCIRLIWRILSPS